jgi:hypothetical protein
VLKSELVAGLCTLMFCAEVLLRNESLRRKLERFWDREGGGDVGGERGVISTDNVGVKDTGVNSGAQSMRVAEERSLEGTGGGFESTFFDDIAALTSTGLFRPILVSSETFGLWFVARVLGGEVVCEGRQSSD